MWSVSAHVPPFSARVIPPFSHGIVPALNLYRDLNMSKRGQQVSLRLELVQQGMPQAASPAQHGSPHADRVGQLAHNEPLEMMVCSCAHCELHVT